MRAASHPAARLATRRPTRRRPPTRVAAAAAAAPGPESDPYAVLGVSQFADAEAFAAARSRKLALAKGDPAQTAAVEAAYEALLMRQLSQRLKGQRAGGVAMSRETAFADRQAAIPWRPRVALVAPREVALNVALGCALGAWSLLHPSPGLQPMTLGLVAFFFRQNAKMVALFPSPGDKEKAKIADAKRMGRTIGLVLGSIAAAILVVTALPQTVASTLGVPLPAWLFIRQEALVNLAACSAMAVTATAFR